MKISGRSIKRRLYGEVSYVSNRLARARYFRGHGIHSPFVYSVVRQVFMKSELLTDKPHLYEELVELGVPRRRAVQIQNLCVHCHYTRFGVNRAEGELYILTADLPCGEFAPFIEKARAAEATVCIMAPYKGREREQTCARIVSEHHCTSIDNRGFLLIFNNSGMPKQHFRL